MKWLKIWLSMPLKMNLVSASHCQDHEVYLAMNDLSAFCRLLNDDAFLIAVGERCYRRHRSTWRTKSMFRFKKQNGTLDNPQRCAKKGSCDEEIR